MEKLLFTELRVLRALGEPSSKGSSTKESIRLALTDRENLRGLGFELKAEGVAQLAKDYAVNPEMTPLYKRVKEFMPDIKASPMYPNFPIQVLEMDDFEYKLHQFIHYLTTYGLEDLLGVPIQEGWLPESPEIMDRIDDEQIASLKTIDYLTPSEINELVISRLIGRNERLLPNELKIAKSVVESNNRPHITEIPFKENIGALYGEILLNGSLEDRHRALEELSLIVKHPGDVLDVTEDLIVRNRYRHLKTSLKRGLVQMIEQFELPAIEENFASNRWSNRFLGKGGRRRAINRNIAIIDYLSFSKFSRKPGVMNIVNELKDGALLSWNQKLERAYEKGDIDEARRMLNQRPGIYFRQVNRLYESGVIGAKLTKDVVKFAEDLKTQSIVSALNNYEGHEQVSKVFYDALIANLKSKDIDTFKDRKIYIEDSEVDLMSSKIPITDKFEDGGYIQSGMAIKLPENAKFVRFFTYWNDKERIDIDLHAAYEAGGGYKGHLGWNGSYDEGGIVYSGDITHSDAAEYMDINLAEARDEGVERIQFNINSYTTIPFRNIDTIFCGLMLLGEMGEEVHLYDSKNVVFRHDLDNNTMATNYAYLDLEKGLLYILGTNSHQHNDRDLIDEVKTRLSIHNYLNLLIALQGGRIVDDKDEADLVVGLGKSDEDNYVSLIDENFFMD